MKQEFVYYVMKIFVLLDVQIEKMIEVISLNMPTYVTKEVPFLFYNKQLEFF
jgi:hypothetical protein